LLIVNLDFLNNEIYVFELKD